MCIKISAVDTTWSWLGRCDLNANLVEKTNLCRDKRGIKFLSVSVILCFMVLTHSFPLQAARWVQPFRWSCAWGIPLHSPHASSPTVPGFPCNPSLDWMSWCSRGWSLYPLGWLADVNESKGLEQRCYQGCYQEPSASAWLPLPGCISYHRKSLRWPCHKAGLRHVLGHFLPHSAHFTPWPRLSRAATQLLMALLTWGAGGEAEVC